MKSNKVSIGNCGEYFVAAELERRGFSVAVPMSNTELFDILAFNRTTHEQWAIQVKTTSREKSEWPLNRKNEDIVGDRIIYVFVKLNDINMPQYYIVPSEDVSKKIKKIHQDWLNTPGRKGQPHKDNPIRTFEDYDNKYLSRWDYLE
ncbi:MAG: aspartate ammonia-lyase [Clostridia bacterium]|nr:aspartate ammonia-lyase [Clostridia bacterium]